ncbi:MAG TPA: hypothetical protein VFW07_02050 [Parafilimonas sp.]|nr:hypothetical protein [Parafilimonas sp.]
MKTVSFFILLFTSATVVMYAQDLTGEYYLEGVMETASGFQINADSGFQFFFSYGALDRSGKGKWKMLNDSTIILNSDKRPPLDFKLEKQTSAADKSITIQIDNNNKNILRYVQGFIKSGPTEIPFEMNAGGIARLENQEIDSVGLIFTLCPDRYSVLPVTRGNNSFVFQFEPWIAEVFFEDFILTYSEGAFTGKHPLLKGDNYIYRKE